jgi:branched-chain amino acid transport system substrate-binding protein
MTSVHVSSSIEVKVSSVNLSHRRRRHVTALSLLLVAALAGCVSPADWRNGAPLAIGILADMAGPTEGNDAVRGARLAVELVNGSYPDVPIPLAAGTGLPNLAGATLTLVPADTKGTPQEASDQADALVATDGAAALVVSDAADVAAAAGSQTQRSRVPLLDARSTADYVTELGMDWYFRTVPTDRALADVSFALLRRQLVGRPNARIALLTEVGADSAAAAALIRDLAARAGYPIVVDRELTAQTDVDTQAQEIAEGRSEVVLVLAHTSAAATEVTRTASRLATPVPVVGLGQGFGQVAGGLGAGDVVLRATSWSAELAHRNPVGKAVTALYERTFGSPMTNEAANSFTATITLAAAIDAAGSREPATIRGALRQISMPATQMIMPWNGIRFNANGQNQLAAGVVEGRDRSGFRVIYPRELAAGPMIWTTGEGSGS